MRTLVTVSRHELRSWDGKRATWWLHLQCGHIEVRFTSNFGYQVGLPALAVKCSKGCRNQTWPLPNGVPTP